MTKTPGKLVSHLTIRRQIWWMLQNLDWSSDGLHQDQTCLWDDVVEAAVLLCHRIVSITDRELKDHFFRSYDSEPLVEFDIHGGGFKVDGAVVSSDERAHPSEIRSWLKEYMGEKVFDRFERRVLDDYDKKRGIFPPESPPVSAPPQSALPPKAGIIKRSKPK